MREDGGVSGTRLKMAEESTNSGKITQERNFTDLTGEKGILEQSTVLRGHRQYLETFKGW